MGIMKGQGSSEYIVMLAVVLIVVLVVAGILGFFPSFGGDTQRSQTSSYWQATEPIAIIDSTQDPSVDPQEVTLVIENHASKEITMTAMTISSATNPAEVSNTSTFTLSAGQKTSIFFAAAGLANCSGRSGKTVAYNVNLTYNTPDLTGKSQVGAKPLLVTCQ